MELPVHNLQNIAAITFGRETAQFRWLLVFMTVVSILLWACVLFTLLLRVLARRIVYRPRRYQPVRLVSTKKGRKGV